MAINPIGEYPEVTELTEEDYLPVGTPTGLKKINASNIGGGGAEDFVVTFTIDGSTVTSDKTVAEIIAAYNTGKKIKGNYEFSGITFLPTLTGIMDTTEAKSVAFYGYQTEGQSREIDGMSTGGQEMWVTSVR